LKFLQDQLGQVQDSHIHRDMLTAFVHSSSPSPAPAVTVLAVGALIDRLDTRRRQAHADLSVALRRVTDAKITGRLSLRAEAAA
jgi:CHAD domain-containing protein